MKDHTESIRVTFDPAVISLEQILNYFWDDINPFIARSSVQYRSALWYSNKEQKRTIKQSVKLLESRTGKTVRIYIGKSLVFTDAEDYHQKFYLRNSSRKYSRLINLDTDPEAQFGPLATKLNSWIRKQWSSDKKSYLREQLQLLDIDERAIKRSIKALIQ
eukprot:TRINITY_DN1079_c0_g3_i1.p1 TRINITY_DN1079_c0_g3~~TRINITY_DN1079_c0_g3_i1.p1  ORF type:complete len:161 (+),score=25.10 TRINITY_DN1079_c0_g3_i1:155-637(+)